MQAPTFTSPHSSVIVFPIDGAHQRRSNDHSAVGNRDAGAVLNIGASWERAEDDEVNIGWARSLWQDARRFSTGGVYVNFLTEDEGEDRIRASYGAQSRAARAREGSVGPGQRVPPEQEHRAPSLRHDVAPPAFLTAGPRGALEIWMPAARATVTVCGRTATGARRSRTVRAVIAEAPFFFSIAALSASLAGLAGLVAGLRRGSDIPARDLFRLRQIVEFAFANVLLALVVIPLTAWLGSIADAVRIAAALSLAYLAAIMVLLARRVRRLHLPRSHAWYVAAVGINLVAIAAALATIASGSQPAFETLMITLLARPMIAFLLVLQSFETPPGAG